MGVIHEYFVLDDDEQAAGLLGSYGDGVLGVEAATELVALEALLMGLSPFGPAIEALMARSDHAVLIAADADAAADVNVVVSRIADHTTALIASSSAEAIAAAMEPWSQVEEFRGQVTEADLAEMMQSLLPLFTRAATQGQHVYVRTSC